MIELFFDSSRHLRVGFFLIAVLACAFTAIAGTTTVRQATPGDDPPKQEDESPSNNASSDGKAASSDDKAASSDDKADEPPSEGGDEPKAESEGEVVGRTEDGTPFSLDQIEHEPMKLKWRRFKDAARGMTRYSLADGKIRFRLGARIQADGTTGNADDGLTDVYGETSTRGDFRRGRIFAEGRVRKMDFRLEFDFTADAGFKDVYLEGIEGGVAIWGKHLGKLRYGHFKEPFSLERQMSSNHLGFLEWSLPVATFAPGRNVGFMIHDKAKSGRFCWAFGLFSFGKKADDNAGTSAFSLTTRWTGMPIYSDDGNTLLHLGASFSSRSPTSDTLEYRTHPEARFAPYLADTGVFDARGNQLLGFEIAGRKGPVWFQTEFIEARTDSESLGDPAFSGYYGQVGWFPTGDVRPYRKANGVWTRVRPKSNYRKGNPFKSSNGGAWMLSARFSAVDLDDREINGGELKNLSIGVSWYLNPTARIMANYIRSKTIDLGSANIFLLRFQYNPD